MNENVANLLEKLKIIKPTYVLILFLAWFGFEYYSFQMAIDGPVFQKKEQLKSVQDEIKQKETQLKKAEEFAKNLDTARKEVETIMKKMEDSQNALPTDFNSSAFLKQLFVEAGKVRVKINKITPGAESQSGEIVKIPFSLDAYGSFVELLMFFDRMASIERIVHIKNFKFRPIDPSAKQYVRCQASINIETYKFLPSQKNSTVQVSAGAPGAPMIPANAQKPMDPGGVK